MVKLAEAKAGKGILSSNRLRDITYNRLERLERKQKKRLKQLAEARTKRVNFGVFRLKKLTDQHRVAIDLLADLHNRWPMEYIAAQAGISVRMLRNWRNDPTFLRELDKELTKRKTTLRTEAYRQLAKFIARGDRGMIRFYLKLTGDLKEEIEVTHKNFDKMDDVQLEDELERRIKELGPGLR